MQLSRSKLLAGSVGLLGALALSACIPPAPEPTPVPSPTPTPASVALPQPAPAPAADVPTNLIRPSFDDWMDAPQTSGDWSYVAEPNETLARFGTGQTSEATSLVIGCNLQTRRIAIGRIGVASSPVEMHIRTETQDRTLTAEPRSSDPGLLIAEMNPRDSLLDAIAFSKGRFAVETEGIAPIYVPAYPEITRVVEDCRS